MAVKIKATKEKLSVNFRMAHKYRRIHAVLLRNPRYTLLRLEISIFLFVELEAGKAKKHT